MTSEGGHLNIATSPKPNESSFLSKVRVPTGRLVMELPAGMLDEDKGDFVGTAVREVCSFSPVAARAQTQTHIIQMFIYVYQKFSLIFFFLWASVC